MRKTLILMLALTSVATATVSSGKPETHDPVRQAEDVVKKARQIMLTDPKQAYRMGRKLEAAISHAPEGNGRRIAMSRALWISGEAALRMSRFELARQLVNRSYGLAMAAGNVKAQADTLLTSGSLRHDTSDVAGALGDYLGAMRLFQALGDGRSQSVALQYLGTLYSEATDYGRAERYYREAAEAYSSDPQLTMSLENNVAGMYMEQGRTHEGLEHFRNAAAIARKHGITALEMHVTNNLARSLVTDGKVAEAVTTIAHAREIGKRAKIGTTEEMHETKAAIALAQGKLALARDEIERVLSSNPGDTNSPGSRELQDLAYRIYKARGENGIALAHLEKERRLREEATSVSLSANTSLMAARFDYASQELRIAKLKADDLSRNVQDERTAALRQRSIFLSLGVGLLVLLSGLCLILAALRRSRDRMKATNAALERALEEVGHREVAERQATKLAEHDVLTGLPNRRHLFERLYAQTEAARGPQDQCSFLLLDLDRFKPINDIYGHEIGDAVLVQVARRLAFISEEHGAKAVRLGGDEFMVVTTAPQGDDAPAQLAMQIINVICAPYEIGDRRLTVGTSIGISRSPHDGATIEELLRSADIAMYEAKHSGRKTFRFFDEAMVVKLKERADIETDMRIAIREGEITSYFQPIYCYGSSRVTGFEALARWPHATRGMIPPDQFIPVAEDAGLIDEITTIIVRQACRAAREWPEEVCVSINLSPVLLRDTWIVAKIFGILTSEGLAFRRLIIEITENAVIEDIDRAAEVINAFRSKGIRISLDDFGKGYSSLSHLRQLKFDHLKLDASFVRTLEDDDSLKIAMAVAGLGRALGLPVTAEGVETDRDAEVIRDLGFSYAQGYYYGRPMPREQARLAAWPGVNDDEDLPVIAA